VVPAPEIGIERRFDDVTRLKPEAEVHRGFNRLNAAGERLVTLAVVESLHRRRELIGARDLLRNGCYCAKEQHRSIPHGSIITLVAQ
jgi:hypothetical protein